MFRKTRIEVDLSAIVQNYRSLRTTIGKDVEFLAVVKANAYGHGDIEVARALEMAGCTKFGVATIEEGVSLRSHGIKSDILVLSGCGTAYVDTILEHRLTPVLSSYEIAHHFNQHLKMPLRVHLKVDTGMGRLGFHADTFLNQFQKIKDMSKLKIEGVMSHFGQAESYESERTLKQKESFLKIVEQLKDTGVSIPYFHMANSASVLYNLGMNLNMVRVGIALYGCSPDKNLLHRRDSLGLKPALKLVSSILSLKKFPKNTFISYGETFKTQRESFIASIPLGYADGWRRSLSNKGYVLVKGGRAPIVGAICMDLFMIDVTDIQGIKIGEEVVCLGSQGEDTIAASQIATWAGTINYEILCQFMPRIPRRHLT